MARQRGGLSEEQVERLRADRAAGRRTRVRVTGPQFGDGVVGTVVAIGEPASDGDDFITVRVKAGGVTDDLRFSPQELSLGGKAAAAAPSAATPAERARPRPSRRPAGPRAPQAAPVAEPPPVVQSPATNAAPAAKPAPAARRSPAASRRAAPLPSVTLTITSAGASWSVSARRGARTVAKNVPVQPGVVTAVAALLDHPGVAEAVGAVNDAARQEAEARAEALRAELAAVEAVLSSHRRP